MKVEASPRRPKTTDLQLLGRLKGLSWLSSPQLRNLDGSMVYRDVNHKGVIFEERGVLDPNTHILLSGTAELSQLNDHRSRIVAILPPGVIFRMPLMPQGIAHNFQWTALNDCRVAQISTEIYLNIILGIAAADYTKMMDNGSDQLAYLFGRYPSFFGLGLLERVAVALLELAHDFGVRNTRGLLLRITVSQRQLAGLVGASRPKVGHMLMELERRKLVVREGRQLAVIVGGLEAVVRSAKYAA